MRKYLPAVVSVCFTTILVFLVEVIVLVHLAKLFQLPDPLPVERELPRR